jgi:DNA mismatch endonuclease (patch repair protein)
MNRTLSPPRAERFRSDRYREEAGHDEMSVNEMENRLDTLSVAQRSERMSRVRCKDTGPEMIVRRMVHAMGHRYRLHRRDLPGCPDLVFARARKAIFVHGCFWHRHPDSACKLARLPKTRLEFWIPKLERYSARDARNIEELRRVGWDVLVIWECQIKDRASLERELRAFLTP